MARKTPKDRTIGENALYCKNAQWSLRANIKEKYWIPPTASEEKKTRWKSGVWNGTEFALEICSQQLEQRRRRTLFSAAPFLSLSSEKPVFCTTYKTDSCLRNVNLKTGTRSSSDYLSEEFQSCFQQRDVILKWFCSEFWKLASF